MPWNSATVTRSNDRVSDAEGRRKYERSSSNRSGDNPCHQYREGSSTRFNRQLGTLGEYGMAGVDNARSPSSMKASSAASRRARWSLDDLSRSARLRRAS